MVKAWLVGAAVMVTCLVIGASVASSAPSHSAVGTTILVLVSTIASVMVSLQCFRWNSRPHMLWCCAVGLPAPGFVVTLNVISAACSGGLSSSTAVGAVVVLAVAVVCVVAFWWQGVKKSGS